MGWFSNQPHKKSFEKQAEKKYSVKLKKNARVIFTAVGWSCDKQTASFANLEWLVQYMYKFDLHGDICSKTDETNPGLLENSSFSLFKIKDVSIRCLAFNFKLVL